jgi:hypothetical protein
LFEEKQKSQGWRSRSPLNHIDFARQITDIRNVPLIWPMSLIKARERRDNGTKDKSFPAEAAAIATD